MIGRQDRDQRQLLYRFRLDEMIPTDHLLRRIDVFTCPLLGTKDLSTGHSTGITPQLADFLNVGVLAAPGPQVDLSWLQRLI